MGVREIRQQPCVMIKNGVIVFFYVDDIVFAYPWAKKAGGAWEAYGYRNLFQ
jgi:hypothetical protein